MAGKIVADTLEHSTAGSLDTQFVVNGSAKAWVNFDGTAGSLSARGSLNSSSLTDNGIGDYTNAYISSLSNGNYSAMVACGDVSGTISRRDEEVYEITASLVKYHIYHTNNENARDEGYVGGLTHGDLA